MKTAVVLLLAMFLFTECALVRNKLVLNKNRKLDSADG